MEKEICACGSSLSFKECCEPLLLGLKKAITAEQLMRSRYTAYTRTQIDYLKKTLAPESRSDFDEANTRQWAQQAKWISLEILSTDQGQSEDSKGTVEFMAKYEHDGVVLEHHEVSQFRKSENNDWYFVDGEAHTHKEGETHQHHVKPQTIIREEAKIGRNEPCTCGSGKKYKKCCGAHS